MTFTESDTGEQMMKKTDETVGGNPAYNYYLL